MSPSKANKKMRALLLGKKEKKEKKKKEKKKKYEKRIARMEYVNNDDDDVHELKRGLKASRETYIVWTSYGVV